MLGPAEVSGVHNRPVIPTVPAPYQYAVRSRYSTEVLVNSYCFLPEVARDQRGKMSNTV